MTVPARSPVPEGQEGEDEVPPLRFGGRQPSSDDTGNEGVDGGPQHAQVGGAFVGCLLLLPVKLSLGDVRTALPRAITAGSMHLLTRPCVCCLWHVGVLVCGRRPKARILCYFPPPAFFSLYRMPRRSTAC